MLKFDDNKIMYLLHSFLKNLIEFQKKIQGLMLQRISIIDLRLQMR